MLSALGAAVTRGAEQAAVWSGREEVRMPEDTEQPADQSEPEQPGRPPDAVLPAETRLDLWAQLPEGSRGKGWEEPEVLAESDDPSRFSKVAANWISPPERVRSFFLDFLRAYSPLVADYYHDFMDLQDAIAAERARSPDDPLDKDPPAAIVEDADIPPARLADVAARYGWGERWGRVLRATALRVMQARLAGKEPSPKDVRRLRRAKSGPSAPKTE